jgi:hypothetical protein
LAWVNRPTVSFRVRLGSFRVRLGRLRVRPLKVPAAGLFFNDLLGLVSRSRLLFVTHGCPGVVRWRPWPAKLSALVRPFPRFDLTLKLPKPNKPEPIIMVYPSPPGV